MSRITPTVFLFVVLSFLLIPRYTTPANAATRVVGNGSSAGCTEAALRTALAGGGTISFNCGGDATIRINALIEIAADTIIDGAGKITLDGAGATRIFYVNKWEKRNGTLLELRNISLVNGRASGALDPEFGGCIYARRSLTRLVNATLRNCEASGRGGALNIYGGEAFVTGGRFEANRAGNGGAIHMDKGGTLTITGGTYTANRAQGDGGAIYIGYSTLHVRDAGFSGNQAEGVTGQNYAGLGGAIYLNGRGATATVAAGTFTGNTAGESGGAIFADYYTVTSVSSSTFSGNQSFPAVAGSYGSGGAIGTARSELALFDSELRDNQAVDGGAIYNGKESRMTITRSRIIGNTGDGNGGGIYNIGGALLIQESHVADNRAGTASGSGKQGGGIVIYSNSDVTIQASTFSGNQVIGGDAAGGGVFMSNANLSIERSTIAGNSAVRGGGLWHNSGATSIEASTIADNQASSSASAIGINNGSPNIRNSLLVGTNERRLCNKTLTSAGANLQWPGNDCGSGITTANPQLQPLNNNGGPTPTMGLNNGSPAINAAGTACAGADQRGFSRNGACDIGAYEYGSAGAPALTNQVMLPLIGR